MLVNKCLSIKVLTVLMFIRSFTIILIKQIIKQESFFDRDNLAVLLEISTG